MNGQFNGKAHQGWGLKSLDSRGVVCFETGSLVAQAVLKQDDPEFLVFLPLLQGSWEDGQGPPHPVYVCGGLEPWALYILGTLLTDLHAQPWNNR